MPHNPEPPKHTRAFFDPIILRNKVLENAKEAFLDKLNKLESHNFKLKVSNLFYPDPKHVFSVQEQKDAILEKQDLSLPLKAKVDMIDKRTGEVVDSKETILARIPWVTDRNTTIMHGVEGSSICQQLLKAGVYCRRAKSGLLESQFNVEPGSGIGGKVVFDPNTQKFSYQIQSSKHHLYSILHDLGVKDEELEKEWGQDLLNRNRAGYNEKETAKLHDKLFANRFSS